MSSSAAKRRDKATHAKHLKLTHFIDDRLGVLEHLRGVVPNLILFGYQGPRAAIPPCPPPANDRPL
ncbi:MAG: hypothetical protein IPG50_11820 [Myxococcales bacterium]|nr:hypothetical protein [Myxococcales bacterium]